MGRHFKTVKCRCYILFGGVPLHIHKHNILELGEYPMEQNCIKLSPERYQDLCVFVIVEHQQTELLGFNKRKQIFGVVFVTRTLGNILLPEPIGQVLGICAN